jgi:hypothetical protein
MRVMSKSNPEDVLYFVELSGEGAGKLTQGERVALELAFRDAFNAACGGDREAATAVHARWDYNEDILDPRNGGPGFFDDLIARAAASLGNKVPPSIEFDCKLNWSLLGRQPGE